MATWSVQLGRSGAWARPGRQDSAARKSCRRCGEHPAVFLRLGQVRRDREHVLCPRCWRSEYDRNVARLLLAS